MSFGTLAAAELLSFRTLLNAALFAGMLVWVLHSLRRLPADWREFRSGSEGESKVAIAVVWVVSGCALLFLVNFLVAIVRRLMS